MISIDKLSDDQHPAIQAKVQELTAGKETRLDKLECLFYFVRDGIRFGFPRTWDQVKASETLQYGIGYCNTKATLFQALCKAAGIPARIHTGWIDIQIMRGIFPSIAFPFMPKAGGHPWLEVELDGEWNPIDAYINDQPLYKGAEKRLRERSVMTAYSLSRAKGPPSCEFNFGEKGFVHMGAVVEDHGTWEDFSEYMASARYLPMSPLQRSLYPLIAILCNRNIEKIRQ